MSRACAVNKTVTQCKSCPWRIDCVPDRDIPNYVPALHEGLTRTIQSGLGTIFQKERHVMACHYSKPGEEFPCAGWLANQLGPGNNIGVRMAVMTGQMPAPEIDGPQHERFEDTLCRPRADGATSTRSSTSSSTRRRASSRSPRAAKSSTDTRPGTKAASNTRTRRRRV